MSLKKVVPVLALIGGIFWVIYGFKYGFWVRKGPGGGFLPILSGTMVAVFSIIMLLSDRKDKSPSEFTLMAFMPAAGLLALALSSYLFGMVISMALYIFLWLKLFEKYKTVGSLMISVCCTTVIYFVFVLWLSVPMPKGILGIL